MPTPDPRITFFDKQAASWDDRAPSTAEVEEQLDEVAPLLQLEAGQSMLEAGCGTGKATAWLARMVAPGTVTAVDFSTQMLVRAEQKDIAAEFLCVDVCSETLAPRLFDVVLCLHSFPHFRDPDAALRHFRACVKPSGRLIVLHLCSSGRVNRCHERIGGAIAMDHMPHTFEWESLLANQGFSPLTHIDRDCLFFLDARPDTR